MVYWRSFYKGWGVSRNMLAHINADGSLDLDWNPSVTGDDPSIRTITVYGSTVFVGGNFSGIDGYSRHNIAAIEAESGEVIVNWACNTNDWVMTLAVSSSVLYVGGFFDNIKDQTRNYIAAVDPDYGTVLNWNPNANNWIYTIVPDGQLIYVGGSFTQIGSQSPQPTRNRIAAINASNGIATEWNPNADASVRTLVTSGSTIYAGGFFTHIGAQSPQPTRNRIAAINVVTGESTNWNPNSNQAVLAIRISGSTIYIGGEFTSVGSQSPRPTRNHIAAINATTGEATDWNPNAGDAVLTLSLSGSNIYTGGRFFSIGGVDRNHIAAIDATTGMLTNWNPNVEGIVENPLGYPIGKVQRLNYQFNGDEDPLDPSWRFCDAGELTYPNIYTISVLGTTIFIGGQFTSVGGESRNNIAALDAVTGEVISEWNPNIDGPVRTLSIHDSIVYVGGYFTTIGHYSRNNIGAINITTGEPTNWDPSANQPVEALAISGNRAYAGGGFTSIGGINIYYVAAIDLVTGDAIENWNPNGANDGVFSIAVHGSKVYVGGLFTYIGNEVRYCIASLDEESGRVEYWSPDASGGDPGTYIRSIIASGSTIYAAGNFTDIGDEERISIAALEVESGKATDWDPDLSYPSIPFMSEVYALAISSTGTQLYAGGFFSEVKDKAQSHFAALTGDGVTVVTNSLVGGWQTLSVPVVVDDFAKTSVWPTANSVAYSFCGSGYVQENTLENGVGYWISFPSEQDIFYAGEFLEQYEVPVCSSWNIVGSISEEVPISTNICLYPEENEFTSVFYIYQNGYQQVSTIQPGMGHWIKVAMNGSLLVNIDPIHCEYPEYISEEELDHFIVTDALGKKQDLYVANLDLNPSLGEMDLSMPPPLPEVGFDARFSQADYIKPVSPDSGEVELEINVETEDYPITLSWELNPENGITYSFIGDSGVGKISDIKTTTGNISFNRRGKNKIRLLASAEKISNSSNHPSVYSLMQNYPNPFNPTTMIKYTLPKVSDVALIIYDILGSEVATLVNEQQQPGSYEVKWDASKISSGIYFYQLKTKDYVDTMKMILLR